MRELIKDTIGLIKMEKSERKGKRKKKKKKKPSARRESNPRPRNHKASVLQPLLPSKGTCLRNDEEIEKKSFQAVLLQANQTLKAQIGLFKLFYYARLNNRSPSSVHLVYSSSTTNAAWNFLAFWSLCGIRVQSQSALKCLSL